MAEIAEFGGLSGSGGVLMVLFMSKNCSKGLFWL